MKILIYSPKFYPSIGGLENLTLMLAKEFMKLGHQVRVICFEKYNGNGIDCGVDTYYSPSIIKQVALYNWSSVFYMPNISLKGLWLKFFNPFKTWAVSHNGWYGPNNGTVSKGINEKAKLFLLRFVRNISVSNAIAQYIPVKSTIIANCYESEIFNLQYDVTRTNNILFVGRLVSDKGIDILVDACILLWEKGMDFKLIIVGKGEMEEWVKATVTQGNLHKKVSLLGKVVGKELAAEMNRYKILAVPSTWHEPFGIVALEGLACGCKVICSNGGGLPEAVGVYGDLFPNGDAKGLSQVLERNLNSDYLPNNKELGEFLQNHSPQKVAGYYLQVFKN